MHKTAAIYKSYTLNVDKRWTLRRFDVDDGADHRFLRST